ncbi:MAG: protein kinase [Phycisphaeraceae bacterium]|nr:MAG: protein kinase [Phycisphaeraceae bacterium]
MTEDPRDLDSPGPEETPDREGPTTPYSPREAETTPVRPEKPGGSDPEAETSAPDVAAGAAGTPGDRKPPRMMPPVDRIEGYTLMGQIGRGGMGTVYLAQRHDDRFRKRVAIKVMRRGMDTEEMLERFRLERQVLGALNHPNIARLFDAGATADGRPYFVMEHIEGIPIDAYCDEHNLSIPERVKLFTKVCAAVHYAHQNLIVHRDLKPSNILVTAEGEPKLLDFGIAKLLNPELLGLPALTRADQRIMTYEYASPEQVQGQQITTASDVYALGVILYELLTGHRPYQIERRLHAEAVRVICEEEPERPSTAVSRAATRHTSHGEMMTITAAEIAKRREVQISRLKKTLAGDLDNIILMALRKSSQRRYTTAQALADDLVRHLDGQTVTARAPTFGYRAGKFLRRNRVAVSAGGAIVLLLIVGVVGFSWAWQRAEAAYGRETVARHEAEEAETAEREAKELAEARYEQLRKMFTIEDAVYDQIEKLPAATAARDVLSKAMLEAIDSLSDSFPGDERLKGDLARQYLRVGVLAGGGENSVSRGVEALEKARALLAAAPQTDHDRLQVGLELARVYERAGDRDASIRAASETAAACEAISGRPGAPADLPTLHADALTRMAISYIFRARYDEAEEALNKAVGLAGGAADKAPDNAEALRSLAFAHEQLGVLAGQRSLKDRELDELSGALELRRRVVQLLPDDDDAARRLVVGEERVGRAYMSLDRYDEAEAHFMAMRTLAEAASKNDPFSGRALSDLARSFEEAADLAIKQDNPQAAESFAAAFVRYSEELERRNPLDVSTRRTLALARYKLGRSLLGQDKAADAAPLFESSIEVLTGLSDEDPDDTRFRRDIMAVAYRVGLARRALDDGEASMEAFRRVLTEAKAAADRGPLDATDRTTTLRAANGLCALAYDKGQGERMLDAVRMAEDVLGERPFLLLRQQIRGLLLTGAANEALDLTREGKKPYLAEGQLSSQQQKELDELVRLEGECEAAVAKQPGFDEPVP